MIYPSSILSRLCLLASILTFYSCSTPVKYNDLPNGDKWRLLAFGDQKFRLDSAELVYMDGLVLNQYLTDTIQSFYNEPFPIADDALWATLERHYSGDSIEYISTNLDFLHSENHLSDTLVYLLKIDRMRTLRQVKDDRFVELTKLDTIIRADSTKKFYTEYKGVYIRSISQHDTAAVREGREILLQYSGTTLSGKLFDDSRKMEGPLRFVFGNEDQVIPGIELALEKMHRKEKIRVIIPSWLAYGARGSAGGHVAPYTTVVYDLEVLQLGN